MDSLFPHLLQSNEIDTLFSSPINGTSILGSYNPMQFVLRLREDVHREIQGIKLGAYIATQYSQKQVQCYSTFLHETIHWWQHVGSTFGLISSFKVPAQAHVVYKDLKTIANSGCFKSIMKFDKLAAAKGQSGCNHSVNNILNYWYDLQFAYIRALDPHAFVKYKDNPYFLTVGHCYHMMWRASIMCLAGNLDKDFIFFPKIFSWTPHFNELSRIGAEGFKEYGDINLPHFGTKAIFEGQARFSQIQFLYQAFNGKYNMNDFAAKGMVKGIYATAIDFFLKFIDEPMPVSPLNPIIGLFLLVCDIAINPGDGFPIEINSFSQFLGNVDPGLRFYNLCVVIKEKKKDFIGVIRNYSRDEYIETGNYLCKHFDWKTPVEIANYIAKDWIEKNEVLTKLLDEEKIHKFQQQELPTRLFFSKFLRFQQDKLLFPHFFCWPGVNTVFHTGCSISMEDACRVFTKHQALFVDDIDGDIYPALFDGYSEQQVSETFNDFFAWNCTYDMVQQWITQPGPFKYDFKWLSSKFTNQQLKNWICHNFKNSFGVHPDEFQIL